MSLAAFYTKPSETTMTWTNVLGLSRTMLALSTLLTLIFNHTNILFAETIDAAPPICISLAKYSLFCILNPNLELARWISVPVLIIVASGWRPRFTCLFHWWITFSLNSTAMILDGGDQVASNLTLLLLPICLTDNRKWHWSVSELSFNELSKKNEIAIFISLSAYFVIRLQVALIYLDSAVEKFRVSEWLDGTAVYYWFLNPFMGANDAIKTLIYPLVTNSFTVAMITWGVLLFELILFLGLVMSKNYRMKLLNAAVIFHFLIAVIHGLFPFFLSMTAALVLYLKPVNERFDLKSL